MIRSKSKMLLKIMKIKKQVRKKVIKIIGEKLKNTYGLKKYKIQEVIKPGQVILIQVIKEERGQKELL